MTPTETHPVGTAARIEQLEAAITRTNAATAAAYDAAANVASFRHDENQILRATWATPKLTGLDDVSEEIRALATPDQTAALDRLLEEAEASVWERAERIARNVGVPVGAGDGCGTYIPGTSADAARAILAASKKGGA